MKRSLFACAIVLALTAAAWAQPNPNEPQPAPRIKPNRQELMLGLLNRFGPEQRPLTALTPQGFFVLRCGVLAKYDAVSLKPAGVIELFGPLAAPMNKTTPEEQQQMLIERGKRVLPAAMTVRGTDLLVVIGEQYFRIDAVGCTTKARGSLTPAGAPDDMWAPERLVKITNPPLLEVNGDVLLVLRDQQLVSVQVADGKVLGTATLPAVMFPTPAALMGRGKERPLLQNDAATRPAPPPVQIVVVGKVVHYVGFWGLKDDEGAQYVLQGAEAERMLKTPQIEGMRVRITGLLSQATEEPQRGKGNLQVATFQLLP